jgi:hypothetical protein
VGLAERRGVKNFQEQKYPALKQQIDAAAGFDVPVEVLWETLQAPEYAHLYDEAFTKVYFVPLIDALKAITIDDLGKDALKASLKKVVIKAEADTSRGIYTFTDGVLTFDHPPVSNLDYGADRKKELQSVLEKGL